MRMLVEAGSVRPDTRAKAILDALKMTARNIFAGLLLEFRKSYDNRRDDAVILRLLTRATGSLRMKGQTLEVALWLRGDLAPATRRAISQFLEGMSQRINEHFGGQPARITIKLQEGAPQL